MIDDTTIPSRAEGPIPRHVAVIMDGNGRWAADRGLPRHEGHRAGMTAVREVVEAALQAGVEILTLFAFSTENWQRPEEEIVALMTLLKLYAESEQEELRGRGVQVRILGELSRIEGPVADAVHRIEEVTAGGDRLRLNLMISYSGRAELVRAARQIAEAVQAGRLAPEDVGLESIEAGLDTAGLPDPDLLVRTSGEFRISNFMLWQLAYTEIHISPVLWPDFTRHCFFEGIRDYQRRDRRFGRVPSAPSVPSIT
jgi:undecaprenyl diphosphate synthase